MAPEIQAVVRAAQAWLQTSWRVQVPFAWLEACVEWLQGEAGGAAHLSQQQINQQVLDQWLLTDLRDLDFPVLPEGLAHAQKTELSGTFCVQVDSLLDISQPAYGQLQKWRGTDCANDEVSAVTQTTQRPWEAKSTRMLLLQVTDGVQSLEAMEYQPIPALSAALRPGAKLQLQGQIVCRLGVLLLGPSNIKILGGEVEDLVDRNNQGRVLCRTLALPEEQQQEGEEAPAQQQGTQEVEDQDLDDAELLASLEAQEEVEMLQVEPARDSGYATLCEAFTQSSRSSSVRSLVSAMSSRSETSTRSDRGGLTRSSTGGLDQGYLNGDEQAEADLFDTVPSVHQEIQDRSMADEDFPDEDFDDLPLDELDSVIFQESENVPTPSHSSYRNIPQNNRIARNPNRATKPQTAQCESHTLSGSGSQLASIRSRSRTQKRDTREASGQLISATPKPLLFPAASEAAHELEFATNDEIDFVDEDMDCILEEVEGSGVQTGKSRGPNQVPVHQEPSRDRESTTYKTETLRSSKQDGQSDSTFPAVTLTSPPFTYLCLLENLVSKPLQNTIEIHVKAFIVTLLGKLSSSNGVWSVSATISDGTGYLDVELSNEVLTGLLGFSVAEKGALKRDPTRRGELDAGMRRCQEELVDMCCIMTVIVQPEGRKAVVTKADPVSEKILQELEQRMKAVAGMKMSYSLQQAINSPRKSIIRGFRQDETHSALCSHLFTMIRGNRQHRRAFLISLLNLFDDSAKTDVNMLLFIADNLACFPYQSQEEPLFIMHHIDISLSVSGSNLLQTFKELLLKEPRRKEKKVKKEWKNMSDGEDEEEKMNCDSPRSEDAENSNSEDDEDNDDDVVRRPKKTRKPVANSDSSESESDLEDLDVEDVEKVMRLLPENPTGLLDFANAVQGILLLLVLKQHLKNQYGFSDSKIQKYSPTESAKVYDKAVNRKSNVHFNPRQTIDFISNNMAHATLTDSVKKQIVKQYLDFKVLMEHLDPDEEDEEGEASASANIRNKAINALLGGSGPFSGPSPRNQAGPETDDDDSDGDERTPGSSRRSKRAGDSSDPGRMSETVEVMDVIALCCPKYKDRPQIARVIQKTSNGYSIHWMAGSYSGPWAEAKKRDGRKLVPWVDTIKESDIIYKKIALTSNHKLSNKVVQTLRSLYAAREGGAS